MPFWATTERTRAMARWGGVATLIMMAVLTLLALSRRSGALMTAIRIAPLLLTAFALAADASAQDRQAADAAFKDSVHAAVGLECASCHKGQAAGAYAAIPRGAIAATCASCHSDAAYMRKFDPQVRVDQMSQYLTSAHGRALSQGRNARRHVFGLPFVARGRPRARFAFAGRAAERGEDVLAVPRRRRRMKAFGHDAKVFTDWSSSVHANALLARGDTFGADLQHLPRQPRRHAAGRHRSGQRVRPVPRARSAELHRRGRRRRSSMRWARPSASSATATTPSSRPSHTLDRV